MTRAAPRRKSSTLALAIALATGGAVAMSGIVAEPAQAQRKKDKAPKADYSDGFRGAYGPVQEGLNANADAASLVALVPALTAASTTPDDRMAAGGAINAIGSRANRPELQLQGIEMMLASGKAPAEDIGRFNIAASQLAFNQKDYGKARRYGEAAIAAGYTENDPELLVAEAYFAEDQTAQGLDYLSRAIESRRSAGQAPPRDWVRRGLAQAYNAKLNNEASRYSILFVENYPSEESWGDAIAIVRNSSQYERPEMLDLLRLARRVNALRQSFDYEEYVDAADARRLPGEVDEVISEGVAAGKLDNSNTFINEAREVARQRIAADRSELPALERDAMASGAPLRTVVAAADALLSYGRYDAAETLYEKALGMGGDDEERLRTRLAIAQLEQGDLAAARRNFATISGQRAPIARLWTIYADQQGGGATLNTAAPEVVGATTEG